MATLSQLSDSNMVTSQKDAMIDKTAPNPSVEAILHAIIPFKFVDHTHSDAVVTITSNKDGERYIRQIYPEFLVIPYVMPGFILAKTIYDMTKNLNWQKCNGIILLNHGIFTFDDDAKISYEKMIDAVSIAEEFLDKNTYLDIKENTSKTTFDTKKLQDIISKQKNYDVFMKINQSPMAVYFASQKDFKQNCQKGVLTPEHIIRTKRIPLVLEDENISKAIDDYQEEYKKYFNRFQKDEIMLDPSPNWAVIKDFGTVSFGKNEKEATIIQDINNHTMEAILRANMLGGFESIGLKDSFEMEYWELEQAKLKG
jgi:rhamnose utilization protein RhaD (predicted bifunctional aldolase and dehydrogenase)